jgi:DNA modification methylase
VWEFKSGADMNSRKLAIEYLPVASLRPDPKNARLHSDKQVQQIAKSIEAFGFNVPVLVDANSQVVAGHGRLSACKRLGIAQVPAIRLEHLSEHQRRAFMIADNRLTENSKWDDQLLGEQLKILSEAELDFTLETTGFELGEIDLRIENLGPASEGGKDPADALPEPCNVQVSRIGDLWQLGKHRVLCGDALSPDSYKSLMGDSRAHAAFASPLYYVPIAGNANDKDKNCDRESLMGSSGMSETKFSELLSKTLACLAMYTQPGSLHYVFMDWRHMNQVLAAGRAAHSELKNVCVWVKDKAGMWSLYRSQHELVFVFQHGESPRRNNVQVGRSRTNVWHYPGASPAARSSSEGDLLAPHPTVKPVKMVADAIMDCSARGDLVIDSFLGDGTTLVAAERTGRICHGLELDPGHVDTVVRRWQAFTGDVAYHVTDGRSFIELEKEAGRE